MCVQYNDFLDRAQLRKHDYVTFRLKLTSSVQKCYDRHHDMVDRYEISISQMTMDFSLFTYIFLFSLTAKTFTGFDCIYE